MIELDARGLSCPEPMLMAKKAMKDAPSEEVSIAVDSASARDNIARVARIEGRDVTVDDEGDGWVVLIK